MDGHRGVLEFRVRNEHADRPLNVKLSVTADVLSGSCTGAVDLGPGAEKLTRMQIDLTGDAPCAGEIEFGVGAAVAEEGSVHRLRGGFSLPILEQGRRTLRDVTINIGSVIEQHGRAGMGAVNEVGLGGMVSIPPTTSINDLLSEGREPRFEVVDLEPVNRIGPPERDGDDLDRCSLHPVDGASTIYVHGAQRLVIGRSRRDADVVAWAMPRSPERDARSRAVSSRQVGLELDDDALLLRRLSGTNETRVDGVALRDAVRLVAGSSMELDLSGAVRLRLHPLPLGLGAAAANIMAESMDDESTRRRWGRAAAAGVGGVLVERTDGWPERYLWVAAHVALPEPTGPGPLLAAIPWLSIADPAAGEPSGLPSSWKRLRAGDELSGPYAPLRVAVAPQSLEDATSPTPRTESMPGG